MSLPFVKMHGLGNDFVIVDARRTPVEIPEGVARAIADRRRGVGFDQLIVIEPPRSPGADAFMRIRNADGGEVGACGNATRCVARLLMDETGRASATVETASGLLACTASGDGASGDGQGTASGLVTVDLGAPRLGWTEIPLARPCDTDRLPLALGALAGPVAVNVGNPHAVFLVDDAEAVEVEAVGPALERDPLFPERANIEFVSLVAPDVLRMRVWERGVGATRACGTGACAAAVAAHRRGLTGRDVTVRLDGGALRIRWRAADDHLLMTGPVGRSFAGILDGSLLAPPESRPAAA